MLRIQGSRKVLCDGVTRRDLLHLGGLGLFGLGLNDLLRLQTLQAASSGGSFGKAKSCLLVYLFGAAPQHETFDPKPDAPREIQGELRAISTSVPGVQFCEGLPQVARIADRLTVIRSLHHAWPFHGVHYAVSGIPSISPTVEADPSDRKLWPFIGSVVDYLGEKKAGGKVPEVPRNIGLPFRLYSKANFRLLGGPYAGFLGSKYDPLWTEFTAQGTRAVPNPKGKQDVFDPYGGIKPSDKFDLAGADGLADGLSPQRLGLRRSLLQQFDEARRWLDTRENVRSHDRFQDVAYGLLSSPRMARALDIQREPLASRDRYGMTLFGQSLLAARRLIEAGGQFVTVFWDAYGDSGAGWDTHSYHYPRLKELLLPGFDQSFSALILDLEARGLLDETLVVCISEHGRTPRIDSKPIGAGRDHWSRVYSGVMAGAGVARGRVVGKSDATGSDVADTPVTPKDVLATAFHMLGIDPHTNVPDLLNRPIPVAGDGVVRREIFG
jgi:hypothetical protein